MNPIEQQINNLQEQLDTLKQQLADQAKHKEPQTSLLKEGEYYMVEEDNGFVAASLGVYTQEAPNSFQSEEAAQAYAKAFETFLLLRHQTGTEKPEEDKVQWVILVDSEGGGAYGESFYGVSYKIDYLSPCFNSEKAAQAAIQTIGEARLMQMFNAFHGIY